MTNPTPSDKRRSSPTLGLFRDAPGSEHRRRSTVASKNAPIHRIRHGVISASIWHQETTKGAMFNVTFQRSYKDGEEWKTSTTFGRNNLLALSFLATRAYEWITNHAEGIRR